MGKPIHRRKTDEILHPAAQALLRHRSARPQGRTRRFHGCDRTPGSRHDRRNRRSPSPEYEYNAVGTGALRAVGAEKEEFRQHWKGEISPEWASDSGRLWSVPTHRTPSLPTSPLRSAEPNVTCTTMPTTTSSSRG